jgi:lysophospholipid acyltransferase (LPLAT)-like uncharacterized protein
LSDQILISTFLFNRILNRITNAEEMPPGSSNKSIKNWNNSFLFKIGIRILVFIIKILMLTCRIEKIEGEKTLKGAISRSAGRLIYVIWHQRIFVAVQVLGGQNITAMVSQSRDGEFAARTARAFGLKDVRGSSTRGGLNALKELIKRIKEGANGGMIADGPLGPARVAKKGVVVLARDSGVPIVPVAWGVDRCWVLNSWDRFIIPKPFAHLIFCYLDPIWVPASVIGDELEKYRKLVEDELNQGNSFCDVYFGVERPWRKAEKNPVQNA